MEGIVGTHPAIEKIDFRQKGSIRLFLRDGRSLTIPLKYFPSIKRLTEKERRRYHIADDQIILFEACDDVFHIEQFLGKEQEYRYHFEGSLAAEPRKRYFQSRKVHK